MANLKTRFRPILDFRRFKANEQMPKVRNGTHKLVALPVRFLHICHLPFFLYAVARSRRILSFCRLPFAFCLLLFLSSSAAAHVGSPDVFFEGNAGPYPVFVTVRLPLVIPGVAEIEIRTQSRDVQEMRIVPLRLTGAGSEYPPTPDVAARSKQDPQFFTGSLWLMEGGALQVRIMVKGARGPGEVAVPVPSVAQRVLPMQKPLGAILLVMLALLAAGAVSIAGAGAREARLEPGVAPTVSSRRRARVVMAIAAALVLGVIFLGGSWWNTEAARYANNVYKPPLVHATLEPGGRLLLRGEPGHLGTRFGLPSETRLDDLIPDHNHLMHLFLVRVPGMDAFWHLHPDQIEPGVFLERLPPMPAGRYRIFADIVHRSGFPETQVGEVTLPSIAGTAMTGDDCAWTGAPLPAAAADLSIDGSANRSTNGSIIGSTISNLPDGDRMVWERPAGALKAKSPLSFQFVVEDAVGKPVEDMEPYMGMPGHAEFIGADLSVFAHVHPSGSVSMAALEIAQSGLSGPSGGEGGDLSMAAMPGMSANPTSHPEATVSFPYGFPQAGLYRIFVQVKHGGRIETGVFDARVE